jgi:hypothetical protein
VRGAPIVALLQAGAPSGLLAIAVVIVCDVALILGALFAGGDAVLLVLDDAHPCVVCCK